MRSDKTSGNSRSFQSSMVIFGNNYPHRLTILFVHFEVSTLKCENDASDITFFKEALTRREGC